MPNVRVQFRKIQEPFTLTLHSVSLKHAAHIFGVALNVSEDNMATEGKSILQPQFIR